MPDHDHDDLALPNIENDRLHARLQASHDASEFSRLVLGDKRTDEELWRAWILGENSEAAKAGAKRFYQREAELMAKNWNPIIREDYS